MPRALRLESENASYHALNRGNYKSPLFRSAKTKLAFLRCLDEACAKTGWLVHAWALGSADFARSLIEENHAIRPGVKRLIADMRAGYEAHWHAELIALLRRVRRSQADLAAGGKSAEWKIAVAAALKARTTVTNRWLSENLHLGNRPEIGRKVAAWHRSCSPSRARKLGIPAPHPTTWPRI